MNHEYPIDRILSRLEGVEKHNDYYKALCPVHSDRKPSLDIKEVGEDGQRRYS